MVVIYIFKIDNNGINDAYMVVDDAYIHSYDENGVFNDANIWFNDTNMLVCCEFGQFNDVNIGFNDKNMLHIPLILSLMIRISKSTMTNIQINNVFRIINWVIWVQSFVELG